MNELRLNNEPFSMYKVKVLSCEIGPYSFKNGHVKPSDSMIPVLLNPKIGTRSISLTLDFEGASVREIERNITKFTMKLQKGAEISLHDGYTYFVVFNKSTTPKQKAPWIQQVKFTLTGYRHGNLVEETFTSPGKLYVDGDYRTPAYIHAFVSQANVTVCGISFELAAVSAQYNQLYIDGMKKTVKQSAMGNIFHKTINMTKFPYLEPGENNINFTTPGVDEVTISYYPIFL